MIATNEQGAFSLAALRTARSRASSARSRFLNAAAARSCFAFSRATARTLRITERNSAALWQRRSLKAISPICRRGNAASRREITNARRSPCFALKYRADDAVAAVGIAIMTLCPVVVVRKKLYH